MRNTVRQALFATGCFLYRMPHFRGRHRLFATALQLAQALGPPVVVEIDGFSLQLDLRDDVSRGLWCTRTFPQGQALQSLCQSGDVVIDVGASIGYTALTAARAVGPAGRVVAVEPAERSFTLLKINAARNFPERIAVVQAACDEDDGMTTLFVSGSSEDFNSLRPDSVVGNVHEEVIRARSLHSLCEELHISPDIVKVDVEGAEWPVLKGLLKSAVHTPRALLVEAYEPNSRGFGYLPSAMCEWLRGHGYHLSLSREIEQFSYSETRVDGPDLHDIIALRSD